MFCLEDSWRKKRIGKKAKRRRGWGAYEEEDGIGARKNGGEGQEIGGEKREGGLKSGSGETLA
jgi:hypothetical protein